MPYPNEIIRALSERIARDSKNAELYLQRGYAWRDLKDFNRALADFEQAVAVDPFCVNALAASAGLRYNAGDYDGCIDDCTRAIGMEHDHVAALCTRAAAYLKKGEPERALEGFEYVLQLEPGRRGALYWRGVAKEALGDLAGAESDYTTSRLMIPPLMGEWN